MRIGILILTALAALIGCEAYHEARHFPPVCRSNKIPPEPGMDVKAPPPPNYPATTQPAGVLTLEEAIAKAVDHSGRIRIADRQILIAQDRVREAWAIDLPKVTAQGRFDIREKENSLLTTGGASNITGKPGSTSVVPRTGGGYTIVHVPTVDRDVSSSSVNLLVPIYNFGLGYHARQAARLGVDVATFTAERDRQDLILNVSLAYFRVLEAQKIKGVVLESIQTVTRQLETARDFLSQGLVARNDVLVVEVQLAERHLQLIQAENNIQLAMATLDRLMDEPVTKEWQLRDILEVSPWQGTFESVFFLAVKTRPDLAALRRQIRIAEEQYRTTRATLAPQVSGYINYTYTDTNNIKDRDAAVGGFVADWNLFDGGLTYAQLARLSKQINDAIDTQSEAEKDVILNVKQAYLSLNSAAESIPVAQKSIEQAEENLRITRDQYAQGLLTSQDVLLQETRLAEVRVAYYQALYAYHEQFATLTDAIGTAPPQATVPRPVRAASQPTSRPAVTGGGL